MTRRADLCLSIAVGVTLLACAEILGFEQGRPSSAGGASGGPTSSTTTSAGGAQGNGGGGHAAGGQSAVYAREVLADGPVLYWRVNEMTGITALDASGSGNDGTYKGGVQLARPGAIAGDPDTAAGFDAGAAVDGGMIFDFDGTIPYTLEVWLRPTSIDTESRYLFNKEITDAGGRQQYGVYVNSQVGLAFERWIDSGEQTLTASAPPLDVYTYIAGTYDGTVLRLFVNAVSVGTLTDARAAAPKAVPFFVGIRSLYSGGFEGDIDEVAVYDKALAQERIQAHYDAATR